MKTLLLLVATACMTGSLGFAQYKNFALTTDNLPDLEIVQIDVVEGATLVHSKWNAEEGSTVCIPKDYVLLDASTYNTFKIIDGLNMPVCNNSELVMGKGAHHFTFVFEQIPFKTASLELKYGSETQKVIEIDWESESAMMNAPGFHGITPFKILETNYVDGSEIKIYHTPKYTVAAQVGAIQEYGKYYRVQLSLVNNSGSSLVLNPNQFVAQYSRDGENWYDAELWTHEEYIQRVNNRQAWTAALVAMSESMAAEEAGQTTTTTTSNYSGTSTTNSSSYGNYNSSSYGNYSAYGSGGSAYGSAYGTTNGTYSAYGTSTTDVNVSGTTTTTTENGYAKYAAQQQANANIAAQTANMNAQKQVLSEGYLKLNTIQDNVQIDGFVQFKYDKKATNMAVTIPFGDDSFLFVW